MANIIYSNARAKTLQNKLLGKDRLSRMTDCLSVFDAVKILSEVGFGGNANQENCSDFEKLIWFEEDALNKFIKEDCPDKELKEFFLIEYDFHNAEVFMRSKYLGIDQVEMLVPEGNYKKDFLKEKIMQDEYKDFNIELAESLKTADWLFTQNKATGINVSSLFKKNLYKCLLRLSRNNKDVRDILTDKIDANNISVSLRIRNFEKFKEFYIEGGEVPKNELKDLNDEQFEILKEKAKGFNKKEYIIPAIESAILNKPFTDLELKADSFALKKLKEKKYSTENMFPFITYVYSKKTELNNVRIVLVGLNNNLQKQEISERLREFYEG